MSLLDQLLNGGTTAKAPAIAVDAANTGSYSAFGSSSKVVDSDKAVAATLTAAAVAAKVTEGNVYKTTFKFVDPAPAAGALASSLALKTDAQVKLAIGADSADLAGIKISINVNGTLYKVFDSLNPNGINTTYGTFEAATGVLTLNALTNKTVTYSGIVVETGIKDDGLVENGESLSVTLSQVDNKFVNSWYVNNTVRMADKVIPDKAVSYSSSMTGSVAKDTFDLSGGNVTTVKSSTVAKINNFDTAKDLIKLPDTGSTDITNVFGHGTLQNNPVQFANLGDLSGTFNEAELKAALGNLDGLDIGAKGFVFAIQLTTGTGTGTGAGATSDTYLVGDANASGKYESGTDLFVKLVGVSSSALNQSNFIDA